MKEQRNKTKIKTELKLLGIEVSSKNGQQNYSFKKKVYV